MRFLACQLGGRLVAHLCKTYETDLFRDFAYQVPAKLNLGDSDAVLVTSTDLVKDKSLMYTCRKAKVPVATLVHSWDNLPAHGLLSAIPDRLLVWNSFMVEEAVDLHGVPPGSRGIFLPGGA